MLDLFYFFENVTGILIRTELNLQMALGSMGLLTILILLIYDIGLSFHVFVSPSISFISVL